MYHHNAPTTHHETISSGANRCKQPVPFVRARQNRQNRGTSRSTSPTSIFTMVSTSSHTLTKSNHTHHPIPDQPDPRDSHFGPPDRPLGTLNLFESSPNHHWLGRYARRRNRPRPPPPSIAHAIAHGHPPTTLIWTLYVAQTRFPTL